MHPFAVAATAAPTVRVQSGVVALLLGLTDLSVHLDVIHLNVSVAAVIREVHGGAAAQVRRRGVVLHVRAQRPVLHGLIVHAQADLLAARAAARAYDDGVVAAATAA